MIDWQILWCLIFNEEQLGNILSKIKEKYFSDLLARSVFNYICTLILKGITPNIELVVSNFPNELEKEKIKLNLSNVIVENNQIEEYITNLRKNYIFNKIKNFGLLINNSNKIEENSFIEKINEILNDICYVEDSKEQDIKDIVDNVLERINREEEKINDAKYYIKSIDDVTNGLSPADYIVIAGRPSMGKSAFMIHLALNNALNNLPVVLLSLEMSREQIMIRMIANASNIELWKLKRIKHRTKEEQETVMNIAKKIRESPLTIDNTPITDINTIHSIVQKSKMKYNGIGLIIIDYLQLMSGGGNNDNSRISEISRNLKHLAVQYNCPIVVGSQLSRLCEQREDNKRPILSDLRDSGSIEQDADLVLMLYRDHYYNYNLENERLLEVMIRKYRNGEIGKIILDYNMKKQTIKPIDLSSPLGNKAKQFFYK